MSWGVASSSMGFMSRNCDGQSQECFNFYDWTLETYLVSLPWKTWGIVLVLLNNPSFSWCYLFSQQNTLTPWCCHPYVSLLVWSFISLLISVFLCWFWCMGFCLAWQYIGLLIINVCTLLPDDSKFVVWFVFVFQDKVVRCTDASFNCLEIAPNEQMDLWRSIFFWGLGCVAWNSPLYQRHGRLNPATGAFPMNS